MKATISSNADIPSVELNQVGGSGRRLLVFRPLALAVALLLLAATSFGQTPKYRATFETKPWPAGWSHGENATTRFMVERIDQAASNEVRVEVRLIWSDSPNTVQPTDQPTAVTQKMGSFGRALNGGQREGPVGAFDVTVLAPGDTRKTMQIAVVVFEKTGSSYAATPGNSIAVAEVWCVWQDYNLTTGPGIVPGGSLASIGNSDGTLTLWLSPPSSFSQWSTVPYKAQLLVGSTSLGSLLDVPRDNGALRYGTATTAPITLTSTSLALGNLGFPSGSSSLVVRLSRPECATDPLCSGGIIYPNELSTTDVTIAGCDAPAASSDLFVGGEPYPAPGQHPIYWTNDPAVGGSTLVIVKPDGAQEVFQLTGTTGSKTFTFVAGTYRIKVRSWAWCGTPGTTLPAYSPWTPEKTLVVKLPGADLATSEAASPANPFEGETSTLTTIVLNNGPESATGVSVQVTIPAGLTVTGTPTPSQGSYSSGVWTVGTLAASAHVTLGVAVKPKTATGGQNLQACATASATAPQDLVPGNNQACTTLTVLYPIPAGQAGQYPGISRAQGNNNTAWRSSAYLLNAGTTGQGAALQVVPRGSATPGTAKGRVSLDPGKIQLIPDLYQFIGAPDGGGSLRLDGDLHAWVRTFNQGVDGTFGQDVPAYTPEIWFGAAAAVMAAEQVVLPVYVAADIKTQPRSNLILQSLDTVPITVTLRIGSKTKDLTLQPGVNTLLATVGADFGASQGPNALIVSATGRWNGYISVIDPKTGDPTTFRGKKPSEAGVAVEFPGVASTTGGTAQWRSELYLCNVTDQTQTVNAEIIPRCTAAPCVTTPVKSKTYTVAASKTLRVPDLYLDMAAPTGAGNLRLAASELLAWVRTYNDQGANGTFGQDVPAVTADAWYDGGQHVFFPVHRRSNLTTEPRTNLNLLSLEATTQQMTLKAGGVERTYSLEPGAYMQIASVSEYQTMPLGDAGLDVVSTGRWTGTVSWVDPATNDPTTLRGATAATDLQATCTASPTSGPEPLDVRFTCTVKGGVWPYGYAWAFGDAATSDLPSPTHRYAQGTWGWSVTVRDAAHHTATGQGSVTVVACSFGINPLSASYAAAGGTGSVAVTAAAGCAWTATSNDSWITVTTGASGSGNGSVGFNVAANTSAARSGSMTIAGRTLTVNQAAGDSPGEITIYLGPGNTVPLTLVKIPAGTFTMGSPDSERGRFSDEGPQQQVTLSQAYYLGKTEVTQGQWAAAMGTAMPSECGSYGIGDAYPVYCVSWDDICGGATGSTCLSTSFVGKLNQKLGTTKLRMPTEAEWERAARGGASISTPFSFGVPASWDLYCGSFPEADPYMWWCGNAGDTSHPVGSKLSNQYGLSDMHGNVWEWVADWYDSYPGIAQIDPTGPPTGSTRVFRGGSFYFGAPYSRSAARFPSGPGDSYGNIGFRLARSLDELPCVYALSPTNASHGAGADTGSVQVTTTSGCAWTAASNVAWLTITSGASGAGTGTVSYAVAANSGSSSRTGAITVQGQTFTVSQPAGDSPAEITIYLGPGNTVPLVLVKIPAGTFTMGSPDSELGRYDREGPQHQVTLSQAYYLGKTEVTQGQWAAVMGTAMPSECGSYGIGDTYPVYCVSWDDICGGASGSACLSTSFIGKLNQKLGTTKLRMPTEAEWERAARGGAATSTPFSFAVPASWDLMCGSFPEADPYMWWCGNAGSTSHAVGSKLPNQYGLYDMHGNLWEWVGDWYDSYTSAAQADPTGPATGSDRVGRGGNWINLAQRCRSAFRGNITPGSRDIGIGFRLARSQ